MSDIENTTAEQLSIFDILSDKLIWNGDFCCFCDGEFSSENSPTFFWVYQGQFGHIVICGYHSFCWESQYDTVKILGGVYED